MYQQQLIRVSRLHKLLDCSKSHIYRLLEDDLLPKPIKIGMGYSALRKADLNKFLKELPKCHSDEEIRVLAKKITEEAKHEG